MSTVALEVVAAFEALPDAGRDEVVAELLVRFPTGARRFTDDDFVDTADEVFLMFDVAEDQVPHHGLGDAVSVW